MVRVPQWVTRQDVEALYESAVPTRTTALLERLERRLVTLVPDLADRIALDPDEDGYLDPETVRDVLVDACMRNLRNPRGLITERSGEYSYSTGARAKQRDSYFTDQELAMLRADEDGTSVGSISLGVPDAIGGRIRRWGRSTSAWTGSRLAGVRPR